MRLTRKVAKLIASERVCRVATAGADGRPHLVPVCHVLAGDKIYFASGDDGRKAVTIDLYSDDWSQLRGVMVQGTARLIERGPRFKQARSRLYAKYPQYAKEAAISPSDSVVVELTPTHVFTWGLD